MCNTYTVLGSLGGIYLVIFVGCGVVWVGGGGKKEDRQHITAKAKKGGQVETKRTANRGLTIMDERFVLWFRFWFFFGGEVFWFFFAQDNPSMCFHKERSYRLVCWEGARSLIWNIRAVRAELRLRFMQVRADVCTCNGE